MAKKCVICDAIKKAKEVKFQNDDIICFRLKDETIVALKDHGTKFTDDQEQYIAEQVGKLWPGKVFYPGKTKHATGTVK